MKVRFDNQSLRINSKKFNPFNFSIYGIDVTPEKIENQVDPFNILGNLAAVKKPSEGQSIMESVRAMQSVLKSKP